MRSVTPSSFFAGLSDLGLIDRIRNSPGTWLCVPDEDWVEAATSEAAESFSIEVRAGTDWPAIASAGSGGGNGPTIVSFVQAATMATLGLDWFSGHQTLSVNEEPKQKYAILCTARSGSTWLCQQLQRVKGLGHPKEHLRPPVLFLWRNARELGFDRMAWIQNLEKAAALNGTFGTKIIAEFLFELRRATESSTLHALVERARYYKWVHLEREDKIAQAVSRYLAMKSDYWHLRTDADPDVYKRRKGMVPYDYREIAYYRDRIVLEDKAIRFLMRRLDLDCLSVSYEQLQAETENTLARIADFLVPNHGKILPREEHQRTVNPMSDDINRRFIERFLKEDRYR